MRQPPPNFSVQVPGGRQYSQPAYRPFSPGMSGNPEAVFNKLIERLTGKVGYLRTLRGGQSAPGPNVMLDIMASLEGAMNVLPRIIERKGGPQLSQLSAQASAETLRGLLSHPQGPQFTLGGSGLSAGGSAAVSTGPSAGVGLGGLLGGLAGAGKRRPPPGSPPTVGDALSGEFSLSDEDVAALLTGPEVRRRGRPAGSGGGGGAGGAGLTRAVTGLTRAVNGLTAVIRRGVGGFGGAGGGGAGGAGGGAEPPGAPGPRLRGGGLLNALAGVAAGGAGVAAAGPLSGLLSYLGSVAEMSLSSTAGGRAGLSDLALTTSIFGKRPDNGLSALSGGLMQTRQDAGVGSLGGLGSILFGRTGARRGRIQGEYRAAPLQDRERRPVQKQRVPVGDGRLPWLDQLKMQLGIDRDSDPLNPANLAINNQPIDYNAPPSPRYIDDDRGGWNNWDDEGRIRTPNRRSRRLKYVPKIPSVEGDGGKTDILPISMVPREQAIVDEVVRTRWLDGTVRTGSQSVVVVPGIGQFV